MLLMLTGLSMSVLGPLLLKGRTISGSDGLFPPDQLQYLTWIREAGKHWLIGNRWDLHPDTRVFLHPGFLISGLAWRYLGLSLQASYLVIWKPVAVLLVFFGFRAYVVRLLPQGWPSRAALFIALFWVTPWSLLAKQTGWGGPPRQYTLDFISGEMWTVQMLLGYLMTAVAIGAMPLVLLAVEKARSSEGWKWIVAASSGILVVMWLQPWQGGELLAIIFIVEIWCWLRRRGAPDLRLVVVLLAGLAPAVYYAILGASDPSWHMASIANRAGAQPLWSWPLWAVLLCIGPLALPALFAIRGEQVEWQDTALRVWPLAVVIVYLQPFGTFPYHSVQGLVLPLAILTVRAFTSERRRWLPRPRWWWVLPVLLAFTVPGTVHKLRLVRDNIHNVAYPYYLFQSEIRALEYIRDYPAAGGVLTDSYGGLLVPPFAGREAYIGPFSWTPSYIFRAHLTGKFFNPPRAPDFLTPTQSKRFERYVISTGVRFIFQECKGQVQAPPSLDGELGGLIKVQRTFGCARVYVLKPTARSRIVSGWVGGP
jgi:hypothetical protein